MKAKLLLIDDNKHLRVTLGDHLAHEGFVVVTRESAESALEYLESGGAADLIILDMNMPGLGGVGFLRRILDAEGQPRYPVLVLTARASMGSFFDSVPVDGFLSKPCAVDALLGKIREILARPRTRPTADDASAEPGDILVLLAEDDPSVSENIERHLAALGCRTVTVREGPAVIEEAVRVRPRLVILKQLLPKMNGSILAPVLAGMPVLRRTPILLYDGSRRYEDPGLFESRLPPSVSRYVASNSGIDLMRAVERLLPGAVLAGV